MQQTEERCTGIVKFYDQRKGFGFITLDAGGGEVFLPRSALQGNAGNGLATGDRVALKVVQNDKGPTAASVTPIRAGDERASRSEGPVERPRRVKGAGPSITKNRAEPAKPATPVRETPAGATEKAAKKVARQPATIKPAAAPSTTHGQPAIAKGDARTVARKAPELGGKATTVPPRSKPKDEQPVQDTTTGKYSGFQDLSLLPSLLRAVTDAGYERPTPIQEKAIPLVLSGKDVLGCAQTGTGKTAAFALPILQRLTTDHATGNQRVQARGKRTLRALILSPTRELAIQIDESFQEYGKYTPLKHVVIFGGVGQDPQVKALNDGVDVLVATPGRLLDLMGQGHVSIGAIEVFVLDEADRMLDMGFIHDVRRVVKELPKKRQTLLFSATMPPEIVDLAQSILHDPAEIRVSPEKVTLDEISQSLYFVPKKQKPLLLIQLLSKSKDITRALVFTRTKHGANQVVKKLVKEGIPALAIHGNKSQTARQKALGDFKHGELRVLVATDVASRGIDVDDISHVIQFDLPNVPETYVHRIGRTGRMGSVGTAISFCDDAERDCLKDIEKLLKRRVPVVVDHPFKA